MYFFILKMRLSVKVFKAVLDAFLIKLQSNHELDSGVLEYLVQNYVVASVYKCYMFQLFKEGSSIMNKWFVIVCDRWSAQIF
jgi:hypothetical protein